MVKKFDCLINKIFFVLLFFNLNCSLLLGFVPAREARRAESIINEAIKYKSVTRFNDGIKIFNKVLEVVSRSPKDKKAFLDKMIALVKRVLESIKSAEDKALFLAVLKVAIVKPFVSLEIDEARARIGLPFLGLAKGEELETIRLTKEKILKDLQEEEKMWRNMLHGRMAMKKDIEARLKEKKKQLKESLEVKTKLFYKLDESIKKRKELPNDILALEYESRKYMVTVEILEGKQKGAIELAKQKNFEKAEKLSDTHRGLAKLKVDFEEKEMLIEEFKKELKEKEKLVKELNRKIGE